MKKRDSNSSALRASAPETHGFRRPFGPAFLHGKTTVFPTLFVFESTPLKHKKSTPLGGTFFMLGKRDSNPRVTGPEPVALPLGYSPEKIIKPL